MLSEKAQNHPVVKAHLPELENVINALVELLDTTIADMKKKIEDNVEGIQRLIKQHEN